MNKLTTLAATLLLAVGCASAPPAELTPVEKICAEKQWDCAGIPDPTIVKSRVVLIIQKHVFGPGAILYGFYLKGEPFIYINPTLTPEREYQTIVHETVHYLVDELGLPLTMCEGEELARKTTAKILKIEYKSDWKQWYGCTSKVGRNFWSGLPYSVSL